MIISPDDYLYTTDPETGRSRYVWNRETLNAAWGSTFRKAKAALRSPKFKKLVLLIGIPASGKSTWLKSHQEPDAVYIDATFVKARDRKKPIQIAKATGKRVEAVILDTPIAVCLDRNQCRTPDREVPEDVVINMAVSLTQEMPTAAEGFDKIIKVHGKTAAQHPPGWKKRKGANGIWDIYEHKSGRVRVQDTKRTHPERYQILGRPETSSLVLEGQLRTSPNNQWLEYRGTSNLKDAFRQAGQIVKQMRVASQNGGIVEVPSHFHPVTLEPPKAKREKFPFEGFIDFQGIEIDVENDAGSTRKGTDPDGTPWKVEMFYPYGEIRGTEGTDGDKLDVYVGPNHDASLVVVIHQADPETGEYDEDKVMLGFDSVEEAIGAYKKQYSKPGFYRDGEHTEMPIGQFWRWVQDRDNMGEKIDKDAALAARIASRHLAGEMRNTKRAARTKYPNILQAIEPYFDDPDEAGYAVDDLVGELRGRVMESFKGLEKTLKPIKAIGHNNEMDGRETENIDYSYTVYFPEEVLLRGTLKAGLKETWRDALRTNGYLKHGAERVPLSPVVLKEITMIVKEDIDWRDLLGNELDPDTEEMIETWMYHKDIIEIDAKTVEYDEYTGEEETWPESDEPEVYFRMKPVSNRVKTEVGFQGTSVVLRVTMPVAISIDRVVAPQDYNYHESRYAAEHKDKVPGGRADKKKPEDFDPKELAMGIKVEREHTDDPDMPREIAMDHLTEDPKYYTHLKEMENKYVKGAARGPKPPSKAEINHATHLLEQGKKGGWWEDAIPPPETLKEMGPADISALIDNLKKKRPFKIKFYGNGQVMFTKKAGTARYPNNIRGADLHEIMENRRQASLSPLERGWSKLAEAVYNKMKGNVTMSSPRIDQAVAQAQKDLAQIAGEDVAQEMIKAKKARDGASNHMTIFTPKETSKILKGLIAEIQKEQEGLPKSEAKYPAREELQGRLQRAAQQGDWKSLGIGHAQKGSNEAYFMVIDWPGGRTLRKEFGLPEGGHDFHVTLGFKGGDVHGVPKDKRTLVKMASRTAALIQAWGIPEELDDEIEITFEPDGDWLNG